MNDTSCRFLFCLVMSMSTLPGPSSAYMPDVAQRSSNTSKIQFFCSKPIEPAQHGSVLCGHSQSMPNTLFVPVQWLLLLLADWGSRQLFSSSDGHFCQYSPFVLTFPTSVLIHLWCAIGKTILFLCNLQWSWCLSMVCFPYPEGKAISLLHQRVTSWIDTINYFTNLTKH